MVAVLLGSLERQKASQRDIYTKQPWHLNGIANASEGRGGAGL